MHYDYSKLNNSKVLDVIEVHFKTRDMTVLEGSEYSYFTSYKNLSLFTLKTVQLSLLTMMKSFIILESKE